MGAKQLAEGVQVAVATHEVTPTLLDEVLDATMARYTEGKLPKRARLASWPAKPKAPPPEPAGSEYEVKRLQLRGMLPPVDETAFLESLRPFGDVFLDEASRLAPPKGYVATEADWLTGEPTQGDVLRAYGARAGEPEASPIPTNAKLVGFVRYSGTPLYKHGRWVLCGICFRESCWLSQRV
jgi:hypothetical protein